MSHVLCASVISYLLLIFPSECSPLPSPGIQLTLFGYVTWSHQRLYPLYHVSLRTYNIWDRSQTRIAGDQIAKCFLLKKKYASPTNVSTSQAVIGLVDYLSIYVLNIHRWRAPVFKKMLSEIGQMYEKNPSKIIDILTSDLSLTHYDPK